MKLWLISQEANDGYDTYDSAVVVAPDEETAKRVHPSGYVFSESDGPSGTWATPENVVAKCVGVAADDLESGQVICASFNAG